MTTSAERSDPSLYPGGEGGQRYYKDAAIRATLEKIARCQRGGEPRRALLSLATGADRILFS